MAKKRIPEVPRDGSEVDFIPQNFMLIDGAEGSAKMRMDLFAKASSVEDLRTDVSGKADKVASATAGDVATLDANGNLVDSGKTLGTSVPADAVFTDAKVTQTKTDSVATAYPLLMTGSVDPSGDATTARYDSGVTLTPSTNTITANISGNAATATTASTLSASSITSGDLNDYRSGGNRYFCNAGNSDNVSNKPSGVTGAFALDVIAHSGGITQLLYSRDSNYSYIRCYTGTSTWTAWDRFSLASDVNGVSLVVNYGENNYTEINTAINNGRVVVLKKTNSTEDVDWAVYGGYNSYTDKTEHYFFGIATDGQRYVYKVDNSNNWTASAIDDSMFQKKLTAGDAILIDSDNVISNGSPVKFSSTIGNPDLSPCSTNVVAQRNRNHLMYTKMSFVNQYGNTGAFVLIPHDLGEGYLYISDNYISVKAIDAPAVVSGTATDKSWTNTIYQTPVALDWTFTLAAGKLLDINVNACVYQTGQTSTPLYRMELVDSSNNVKTYFSWVPREMDASETDPDRSTLNGRLVWKNSTSASVTLSLRISDKEQAPTGTTQLKSIRIDGVVS